MTPLPVQKQAPQFPSPDLTAQLKLSQAIGTTMALQNSSQAQALAADQLSQSLTPKPAK
jgi:hypothetical protein